MRETEPSDTQTVNLNSTVITATTVLSH